MPKYVIERGIPGAGELNADQLADIAASSNDVIADLGGDLHWVHSYVTDDKLYCVYMAPDPERLYEHARCGGFPADSVAEVQAMFDPTTAKARVAA
jgi:Protein of unknown function (DUF4242)